MATGQKVTITCRTSINIDDYINWYKKKFWEAPCFRSQSFISGVPFRFISSGYRINCNPAIDGMQSDAAANYLSEQRNNLLLKVIYPLIETCRYCLLHDLSCYWSCQCAILVVLSFIFPNTCIHTSFCNFYSLNIPPFCFWNISLGRAWNSLSSFSREAS